MAQLTANCAVLAIIAPKNRESINFEKVGCEMALFLLVIIYLAFISLGLPDSILGAAWPVMQPDLGVPLEAAGYLFMTIAGCTIISSLVSGAILKRFGTGKVTLVSCLMTAVALLGFSVAPSLIWLFACAIPLGLGAGAVDSGLNHYVASHYKAHHMSWLHCFWGVGATLGPIVMAHYIAGQASWTSGYMAISGLQFSLVIILLLTLPLWGKVRRSPLFEQDMTDEEAISDQKNVSPLKIKGVPFALLTFLFYCSVEAGVGLWGSSYLVETKGVPAAAAAQWVSFYYAGITVGRFITGFVTFKISNRTLIRTGQLIAITGALLLLLPLPAAVSLTGFIMIGLGLAPIFPCMLHETPARFGKTHAQSIMGYQMAVAYTGSTFMPPLIGFLAASFTLGIFPVCVFAFTALMLFSSEKLNRIIKKKQLMAHNEAGSSFY